MDGATVNGVLEVVDGTAGLTRLSLNAKGNIGIGSMATDHYRFEARKDYTGWVGLFKNYGAGAYGLSIDLSGSTGFSGAYALAVYTQRNTGFFVHNDGNVLLGTTSFSYGGSTGTMLSKGRINIENSGTATAYAVGFYNRNGRVGAITTAGGSTNFITSSDHRLKTDVVPLTGAVARCKQLKPSRFRFLASPGVIVDGFLAHEVEEVVPEAVTGEKDAIDDNGQPVYQGVDHSKLVALTVAAVNEVEGRVAKLESVVKSQQSVITQLLAQNRELIAQLQASKL